MNCQEFEQRAWAEPRCREPEFARHREACPECGKLAAEILAFDGELGREMAVAVPAGLARRIRQRQRAQFPELRPGLLERLFGGAPAWLNAYAAAASLLLVVGLVSGLPGGRDQPEPLDRLVTAHYLNEAFATKVDMAVDRGQVEQLMSGFGARLQGELQQVTFAEPCVMEKGIKGAHLVLDTAAGKVTVLILHHREVQHAQTLAIGKETGRILPFGRGSMTVIGPDARTLDGVERQVRSAVRWL
jgi:hypothetical protein